MGAWGDGIFSDDLACDIRGEYRELLEDGVSDEEAARRIIEEYDYADSDDAHILWLALAAAQSTFGRLDQHVRTRAVAVIDEGLGLERWVEAGPRELAKRTAALQKLRGQLLGPQPQRKPVRRPWRHVTGLKQGDVLRYAGDAGSSVLLRVARIEDSRLGAAPILQVLDWRRPDVPAGWRLRRLKPLPQARGHAPATSYHVARHRKKDPDWADVGLTLVGSTSPRTGDDQAQARSYTTWSPLPQVLAREHLRP